MKKYLEYFDGAFDSTVADKREPENKPYVAYSKIDGVVYTIIPKEDGYTLITLKKVDISNISYEEVDLGLKSGLKWANKNIGAQTVEDYGTHFSWGNTDGYTVSGTKFLTVDEACQLFSGVTGETVTTKEELENMLSLMGMTVDNLGIVDGYSFDENTYNGTSGAGFTEDVLDSTHDAATSIMGDSWRMPTIDEVGELINNTTQTFVDLDGNEYSKEQAQNGAVEAGKLKGVKFTGSNNNSIFIPAAGLCHVSLLSGVGVCGMLWSSSLFGGSDGSASYLLFDYDGGVNEYGYIRCCGLSVRGVQP
jgi:hypothetical protein